MRKCAGVEECGLCLAACPSVAIRAAEEPREGHDADGPVRVVRVDWRACDDCGTCADICPSGALSMWGKRYTVQEVMDRVLRDRPFFERSGGGVTVSGGEPLSQAEFAFALLTACRDEGLHTALDTTGYAPWDVVERVLPVTDLFLLDIKSLDPRAHLNAVGVSNDLILENARRLASRGARMQIRIPLITRFNDSVESMKATGDFIRELGEAVDLVQLLPYHAMGVPKWERIRPAGPVLEATALPDGRVEELRLILETCGRHVQVH
jgi:pyruvate formate lyase activating enzyme